MISVKIKLKEMVQEEKRIYPSIYIQDILGNTWHKSPEIYFMDECGE